MPPVMVDEGFVHTEEVLAEATVVAMGLGAGTTASSPLNEATLSPEALGQVLHIAVRTMLRSVEVRSEASPGCSLKG